MKPISKNTPQPPRSPLNPFEEILDHCDQVCLALKALSHPARLQVLWHLSENEKTVTELVDLCKTSQSAMSQFLTRLKHEELITSRKEGTFVYHGLKDTKLKQLLKVIKEIYRK
jgi:ArsR family transcriptional regulator